MSLSLSRVHTHIHTYASFLSFLQGRDVANPYIYIPVPVSDLLIGSIRSFHIHTLLEKKKNAQATCIQYSEHMIDQSGPARPGPARCGLVWFILLNLPTSFSGVKMNILFTQLSSARVRSNHIRSDWISLDQASCLVIASRSTSEIKPSNRSLGHGSVGFGRVAPPLPCSGRFSFSFCGAYLRVRSGDERWDGWDGDW